MLMIFWPGQRSDVSDTIKQTTVRSEKTPLPTPPKAAASKAPEDDMDLEIVTLLGFDAIPAILDPRFAAASDADDWMAPNELVLGVSINGDNRAYSIPFLSSREIVNDVVGGEKIAVTW